MAKSKKTKHEQEQRSEEEELEDELDDDEYDEDEYDEDELDEDELDDDELDDDEYEEDEGEPAAFGVADPPEDPFWWTPHLALSVILIVSLLGFFGLFNPWLGFLAPHPDGGHDDGHHGDAPATTQAPAAAAPAPEPPTPAKRQPAQDVMGARHILVAYKGAMRARPEVTRSKEEAQKRGAEAAAKAKKLGKPDERVDDWTKLVEEYSDEPGAAKRGGDLGRFRKGSFHKDFVAGTEKLKVGEISGPVESPFGFHIIWRTY